MTDNLLIQSRWYVGNPFNYDEPVDQKSFEFENKIYINIRSNIDINYIPEIIEEMITPDNQEEMEQKYYPLYELLAGDRLEKSKFYLELLKLYPEIYNFFMKDKVTIKKNLITSLEFKIEENKFQTQNDEGYTLNEIGYLAGELFKVYYWFRPGLRLNAMVFFELTMKLNKNALVVKIEADT